MLSVNGRMGIYVEIPICASMDELWEKTQNPHLHQRWDLRFNQIEYLPRGAGEPQKFLYRTRIGFGFTINGNGESVGTKEGDCGERTSSLKFWSADPKSLIKVGSGYWKYVPGRNHDSFLYLVRLRNSLQRVWKSNRRVHLSSPAGLGHGLELRPVAPLDRERYSAGSVARSRPRLSRRTQHNCLHLALSRFSSEAALSRCHRTGSSQQNWYARLRACNAAVTVAGLVELLFSFLLDSSVAAKLALVADFGVHASRYSGGGDHRADLSQRGIQSTHFESRSRRPGCHRNHCRTGPAKRSPLPPHSGQIQMRSIYEQALGEEFKLLHPRMQERFGFSSQGRPRIDR